MSIEQQNVITRIAEGGAIVAGVAVMPGTDTNKQVKLPTSAGVRAVGITLVGADAAAKPVSIVAGGTVKAIADGVIAVGDALIVGGTDGHIAAAAPSQGANALIIGMALSSAAQDGDEFDMLVAPSVMQGA